VYQVLFVDLDAKQLHSVVGDEGRIIPKKVQKALIAALSDDTGLFVHDAVIFGIYQC